MKDHRIGAGWLGLIAGVLWGVAGEASAQAPVGETQAAESTTWAGTGYAGASLPPAAAGLEVPLSALPAKVRDGVRLVLERPTLAVAGPTEVFRGCPDLYHWLLDHPDQAVTLWRRLGAQCVEITDRGAGQFSWTDGHGSEIQWEAVHCGVHQRIWYAEGKARPGALLPPVPVRAVVVMHFGDECDRAGRPILYQQADLFIQTDSKAVVLVARMMGQSAPRLAEQGVAQLEMFFSALVWYFDRHPERVATLELEKVLPEVARLAAISADEGRP